MREKAGRRYGLQVFVVVSPDDLLAIDAEDLLTCQSEEVVTQTVDEAQDIHIQRRLAIEAVDDALGTTADGTADVRSGRDRSTRGEDEGLIGGTISSRRSISRSTRATALSVTEVTVCTSSCVVSVAR